MPLIEIRHAHDMDHQQVRRKVDEVAGELADRHGVRYHWEGDSLAFSRAGLSGSIAVHHDHVLVLANLGLALTPLKPKLTREIQRLLDQHFPHSGDPVDA